MLLRDTYYADKGINSSIYNFNLTPENWVKYYHCAKSNWEKYGDGGPPVGEKVVTLSGGREGQNRVIGERQPGRFPYMKLMKNDEEYEIVEYKFWWLHVSVPEFVPFKYDWRK